MDLSLQPKQGQAFLSPATEILYGGAAGGGKSHLLRVAAIAWCYDIAGLQLYLFRRTHPELSRNHLVGPTSLLALLGPWLRRGFVRYSATQNTIRFANGSVIHLCHCQHNRDVTQYQGAEMHVLMIDELTQWEADVYAFLRGRVRLGGLELPARHRQRFPRILTSANPGGIGHNWVKATFVDLAKPFSVVQVSPGEGGMRRQFIPARLEDNPALSKFDPDYEKRLEGLGSPGLVRALRHGDWNIVAGGMFDDVWDPDRNIVVPFAIPEGWRLDRSFDWGAARPFSVGWWAESDGSDVPLPDGSSRATRRGDLFRIAEWYGWNGKPNQGCRMLAKEIAEGIRDREYALGRAVQPGPADSSIFDRNNGPSIAEDMADAGVHWTKADKSPGSRKQGWQRLRRLFSAARGGEEPGLYVFDSCRHFIRTLPVLPRDARDPDDVDSGAEDHIADETRYRIYAKRPVLRKSKLDGL